MAPLPSSRSRFRAFCAEYAETKKQAVPATERRTQLRDYVRWLKPWRTALAVIFAAALVSMCLDLVLPMATRLLIDKVLLAPGLDRAAKLMKLHRIAAVTLLAVILAQVLTTTQDLRMAALNARIIVDLRRRLFAHLLRLPLATLAELKVGGIVSRLSAEVDLLTALIPTAVISPLVAAVRIVVTMTILVHVRWQMAIAAAAMLPLVVLVSSFYITRSRPLHRSIAEGRTQADARAAEAFGGIRVVRSFRRETKERHDYALAQHTIVRKGLLVETVQKLLDGSWALLVPLTGFLIVWFGGTLFLSGNATIGDIIAFQMYSAMLLLPVWNLVASFSQMQRSLAVMERIFTLLDKPREMPDRAGAQPAPTDIHELRFVHLSFGYHPEKPVLHDIDLTLPGRKTVAIIGPSGAGKTTLTDLVARFLDPTAGAVLVNGIDLRDLALDSYRARLAVVPQDVFLFDGAVHENIAYGRRGATLDEIQDAARRANAHTFITALEHGYDTLIGERGVKLSGGQRQRLSIARAILADPEILILDEATSNLDTENEQLIQEALTELFRGRTTLVIAHRLSTVQHADLIVVLAEGHVRETGTHAELIARGGLYARMVEQQSRPVIDQHDQDHAAGRRSAGYESEVRA